MRLITLLCLLPLLVAPLSAAPLDASQEKAVEKLISDYFIRNPEKLEQALDAYRAHMQLREEQLFEQTLSENAPALYNNKMDFSMGPANAPITIVEFFDYNCGYCKRVFSPLMEVMKDNKDVRLVFKELPILSEDSDRAARLALAIGDRLQFLTFHTKLMTHRGKINQAVLDKTLADMKLDKAALSQKAKAPEIEAHLAANEMLAQKLGISGTPAFIINNQFYPGALEKQQLDDLLVEIRADLKASR